LGQRLGPRQPFFSMVRSSQILWPQIADSNVVFLGPPRFFGERLTNLPMSLEVIETTDGFRVVHPKEREPQVFAYRDPSVFFTEDGEARVLVTHAAGPAGNTDILIFASNSTFARAGAVDAFTEPDFARNLVEKMRGPGKGIPRYYQVLLQVKYKGGVPTETSYILHRELLRRQ
jgi:hypothetical protein